MFPPRRRSSGGDGPDPYFFTKRAADRDALARGGVVLRPSFVWGPGDLSMRSGIGGARTSEAPVLAPLALALLASAALAAEPVATAVGEGDLDAAEAQLAAGTFAREDLVAWRARLATLRGEAPTAEGFRAGRASPEALVPLADALLDGFRDDRAARAVVRAAAALPDDEPGVVQLRAWQALLADGRGWGACRGCEAGVEVPLVTVANLPLVRARVAGHDGVFVVDTGAPTHALFADWAAEAGIAAAPGTTYAVGSSGGEVQTSLARADLALGPATFEGAPFAILDSRILPGVAGIVSPQSFAWDGHVELDLGAGRLALRDGLPPAEDAVPTLWVDGVPFVSVGIDDRAPGWFLVDTGASSTRAQEAYAGPGEGEAAGGVSAGGAVKARTLPGAHAVALAGQRVPLPSLLVVPDGTPADDAPRRSGLLGLDALGDRIVRVGRRAGAIGISRASTRPAPKAGDAVRLRVLHVPDCVLEERVVEVGAGAVVESGWSCGEAAGRLRVRVAPGAPLGWMVARRAAEAWTPGAEGWEALATKDVPARWRDLFVPFKTSGAPSLDVRDLGGQACGVMTLAAEAAGAPATFETWTCPGSPFDVRRLVVRAASGEVRFGFEAL